MKHGTLGHRESDKPGLSEHTGVLDREAPTSKRQRRWWEYVTKTEKRAEALFLLLREPDGARFFIRPSFRKIGKYCFLQLFLYGRCAGTGAGVGMPAVIGMPVQHCRISDAVQAPEDRDGFRTEANVSDLDLVHKKTSFVRTD